eukprot:1158099-Pelagomonas_calceolata.AAC.12
MTQVWNGQAVQGALQPAHRQTDVSYTYFHDAGVEWAGCPAGPPACTQTDRQTGRVHRGAMIRGGFMVMALNGQTLNVQDGLLGFASGLPIQAGKRQGTRRVCDRMRNCSLDTAKAIGGSRQATRNKGLEVSIHTYNSRHRWAWAPGSQAGKRPVYAGYWYTWALWGQGEWIGHSCHTL